MRKYIIWGMSFFACLTVSAQQHKMILIKEYMLGKPNFYTQDLLSFQTVDTCLYELKYNLTIIPDTLSNQRYGDLLILQIGKSKTKFFSETAYLKDSISTQMAKYGKIDMDTTRRKWALSAYTLWAEYYSDNASHSFCVRNRIPMSWTDGYIYRDSVQTFDWQLTGRDTVILGYHCFHARTKFRGRSWNIWFSPKIGQNVCVWKFHSLPGLILKFEDSQQHYSFECCSISESRAPILCYERKYKEIPREKWIRIERNFHQAPLETSAPFEAKVFFCPSDGSRMRLMTEWTIPYNPIELE